MFVVSKLAVLPLSPLNLLLLALLLALVLLRTRKAIWGRRIVGGCAAILLALAVLPWEGWLLVPLEERFPRPRLPDHVDGIVVLGGGAEPVISVARGQPGLNDAAERLTVLVELGRQYPQARLVYTGGSSSLTHQEFKEAPVAKDLLQRLGFDVSRVAFEGQSRNTRENAVYSQALVHPQPGEIWLLVTSAAHMPRAVGTFRAVGWSVLAFPVDYRTHDLGGHWRFNVAGGLGAISAAAHEWLGLAYYRFRGWSDQLYPGPQDDL
ncbi:MAG: YdcF family protein [Magnetospirillum sp.]|nr:YdcF family protein [Magnetospirillum sp.]